VPPWPAPIDQVIFKQAQAKLTARAPKVIHPRQVDSPYLLSGIIHCGKCGATMIGRGSSRRYQYYICGNTHRKGREVCSSAMLPKDKVEGFVIDSIKGYILTEENLEELVRLTNKELARNSSTEKEKLELLHSQIAEVDSRLGKLYDALETGEFRSGELAPRIHTLLEKKEQLQQAKADAEEALSFNKADVTDPQLVHCYTDDLRNLLAESFITEQRSFLKSFVERIDVDDSEVKVYYTIPVPSDGISQEITRVLPFVHHG